MSKKNNPEAEEDWQIAWKSMITILLFQTEEDKDGYNQYSVNKTEESLNDPRIYNRQERQSNKEKIAGYMNKRVFKFKDLRYLFRDETEIDFEHSDGFFTFAHLEDLTDDQMFSLREKFKEFSKWCNEKLKGMQAFFNRRDYDGDSSGFTEFALIQERGWNDYPRTRFSVTTRKGKYNLARRLASDETTLGIRKATQRLILKICDLTRVLNFFDSEFDDIVDEMGQYGVIKDMPEARADLVNILKEIDEVNGYDEVDENDSVIPQLEGNINWSKKGQQLIRPLKQKIEAEKERRRVAEEERRKAATQVAPATKQQTSAAASQSSAAADKLASQHYTKLRRKPRKKPPGSFDINLEKLRELQERRKTRRRRPESASQPTAPVPAVPVPAAPEAAPSAAAKPASSAATKSAVVRGRCPFCLKNVTTEHARIKVNGIYYHAVCYEAKEQGWKSRESGSQPGNALYRHSQLSPNWRWDKPKKEGDKYVGGRKTKRRKRRRKTKKRKSRRKKRKTRKR